MKNTSLKEILFAFGMKVGVSRDKVFVGSDNIEAAAKLITQHFEACVPEKKLRPQSGPQRNGTSQAVRRAYNQAIQDTINNIKGAGK